MFRLIVSKELREIISSAKFAFTFGVCSVLDRAGVLSGRPGLPRRARAVRRGRRGGPPTARGPDRLARRVPVGVPATATALLPGAGNLQRHRPNDRGSGTRQPAFGGEPFRRGAACWRVFRFVDLEFTFQVVLSLLAILFAFDAVCGERERGTLRLTFSQAVPRATYIMGKIVGALLALTVPLLIPLAAGGLLLVVMQVPMTGEDWLLLGLVVLSGMLYIGAILGLSVLVSALTRRSSTAFVFLLCLWVVGCAGRAAGLGADGRALGRAVPSMDQQLSQRSRLRAQLWREDQKAIGDFLRNEIELAQRAGRRRPAAGCRRGLQQQVRRARRGAPGQARSARRAPRRGAAQPAGPATAPGPGSGPRLAGVRLLAGVVPPGPDLAGAAPALPGPGRGVPGALRRVSEGQDRPQRGGRHPDDRQDPLTRTRKSRGRSTRPIYRPSTGGHSPASRAIQAGVFDLSLLALFNLLFLFFALRFASSWPCISWRYDVRYREYSEEKEPERREGPDMT